MERTLVLIKPAVPKEEWDSVLSYYCMFEIVATKTWNRLPKELAAALYAEHIGRGWFEELIDYITSGPVMALILEGDNVIQKVREINGDKNNPDLGTIRARWGSLKQMAVHGSENQKAADREIALFFP